MDLRLSIILLVLGLSFLTAGIIYLFGYFLLDLVNGYPPPIVNYDGYFLPKRTEKEKRQIVIVIVIGIALFLLGMIAGGYGY